ncbi:hypothetical protein [Actinomadura algeriensis]|uniref:Uncharacterized protein n=1 Tax=Actinomadura algeriensis TaxID=1679523 RepID=A0ABR9JSM9_9ACTN|nr:hypothetical protein [Actinomadura algeriensis]MBE1533356.1 hypothetical protein [Actinomadura algeriensis]
MSIAPDDWRRIDLRLRMTVETGHVVIRAMRWRGGSRWVEPVPDLVRIAARLRSIMYRSGEGTWFAMRFMMDPPDAYWVSYNRKHDPLWDPPLPAEEWEHELTTFPRKHEHTPQWLRDRLQGSRKT